MTDEVDKLRELADLHASGALSDAEFAAAKATVLGVPAPRPADSAPRDRDGRSAAVRYRFLLSAAALGAAAVVAFLVLRESDDVPEDNSLIQVRDFVVGTWMCDTIDGQVDVTVNSDHTWAVYYRDGSHSEDGVWRLSSSGIEVAGDSVDSATYFTVQDVPDAVEISNGAAVLEGGRDTAEVSVPDESTVSVTWRIHSEAGWAMCTRSDFHGE
jgi:hypothetical protein